MSDMAEVNIHVEGGTGVPAYVVPAEQPQPTAMAPEPQPVATYAPEAVAAPASAPTLAPAPVAAPATDHQGHHAVNMAADNKSGGAVGHAADKANAAITENKTIQAASSALSPGFMEPFFGCFSSVPGCLLSCCCPCVVAAANEANVAERPVTLVDCLFCCPSPYTTRQTLRKKYNMGYAPFNDCAALYCCACCFMHQTTREIAKRSGQAPEYFKMM